MKKISALAGISTLLAVSLLLLVMHKGATATDVRLLHGIHHLSSPVLDRFFEAVTWLGDPAAVAGLSFIIILALLAKKRWSQAAFFTVAIGGAAVLNIVLKGVVARMRPALWHHLVVETNYSFPSGHAMGSAALVFAVLYLLRHWRRRSLLVVIGALYLGLIGISRLYLGVHYPSDVVGGWLTSLAWVSLSALLIRFYESRHTVAISSPSA